MKKVVTVSFFDIEFDNRVKKCLECFGGADEKIILYNNSRKANYIDEAHLDFKYMNAYAKSENKILRILGIFLFFLKKLIAIKPDLIICNDIQPVPSVLLYKFLFNKKVDVIYDSHEIQQTLYPSSVKTVFKLESMIMSASIMNLTVSDSISEFMQQQYGKTVFVLPNYPSLTNGGVISRNYLCNKYNLDVEDKLIVYTGVLMQTERCLGEAVKCLNYLEHNYKLIISAVGNVDEFKAFVFNVCRENNIETSRIRFVGPYNEIDLLDLLRACDVSLLLYNYRLSKNLDINAPNKLFQGLVAGIPLLMSDNTSFKKMVKDSPVYIGELVDPLDVKAISEKIKSIIEKEDILEKRKQIEAYGRKFSWDSVSAEMKRIFLEKSNG
jgi:glycosyltransferase involved in cell wall biosynthesis